MNITTPVDKSGKIDKLSDAISKFEKQFAKEDDDENYYHLVIVGELNRNVCDAIQNEYLSAGWSKVICRTSSENGEHGGLTGLQLWR